MNRGTFGEDYAAQMLEQKGFRILARNFRIREGEIDLIAENECFLVFAEVKLRRNMRYGAAREFVTSAKQRKLIAAAGQWLALHQTSLQPRFDVIEIYLEHGGHMPYRVCHLENAFGA